ncbi:hypothetical protein ACF06X_07390 [Streptomyces sp. NPDC015346]|uniref:hypothetical protein n=1 Tax=Streptomyces sp. NPDC015346 TaxID=3364954 RepID=UPI0036F9CD09
MSISSPIPVLRGSGGVVLQAEEDDLVLTRGREETRIPLQAVRTVQAEGRAVAVELTAPAGSTPAVHRVGGVSEAAATMFADAVNASLPESADESAEAADGSALVTVSTLTESDEDAWFRKFTFWAWTAGLLIVAMTVVIGILGPMEMAVLFLLVTPFGVGITAFGAGLLSHMYDIWYLPRHGITVEAKRNGVSYVYTDMQGATHSRIDLLGRSTAPTVQVAYRPGRPGVSTFVYSWLRKVWLTSFWLVILLVGLAITAVSVAIVVELF